MLPSHAALRPRPHAADREVRALLARDFIALWVNRLPDGQDAVGTLITITDPTGSTEYARFDTFVPPDVLAATLRETSRQTH